MSYPETRVLWASLTGFGPLYKDIDILWHERTKCESFNTVDGIGSLCRVASEQLPDVQCWETSHLLTCFPARAKSTRSEVKFIAPVQVIPHHIFNFLLQPACCIFSPGQLGRTYSLTKMRPADEWRSTGVDLLVSPASGCLLTSSFSFSSRRCYSYTIVRMYNIIYQVLM